MARTASFPVNHSGDGEDRIFRRLLEAPLFQTYRKAFTDATGLALNLVPAGFGVEDEQWFSNPFCREINRGRSSCGECAKAHQCLGEVSGERSETVTCFAGLRETGIPVRSANRTVALLHTGQVFTNEPDPAAFDAIGERLRGDGESEERIDELRRLWVEGPVKSREAYEGAITLLAAFAIQLSEYVNRLMIEDAHSEPEVVTRAKQYVNSHLDEKITLEMVARHVGVSPFYFCKVFKQSVEMTLTEYVNRRRVEWAKRKLMNPRVRVTEVAFDVGYLSLSQFNRSFLKYVGLSPSQYRKKHAVSNAATAVVA